MATISITVTDAQAAVLPIRTNDAGQATETLAQFCQRQMDSIADIAGKQERQLNFDAINATQQTAAIASQG